MDKFSNDINRGYFNYIVNGASDAVFGRGVGRFVRQNSVLWAIVQPVLFGARGVRYLPRLVFWAKAVTMLLSYYKAAKGSARGDLFKLALQKVGIFNLQYPLHMYPILGKSLLAAASDEMIGDFRGKRIVELATGEGSFSSKVFWPDAQVTALDLNPYSLYQTRNMPHIDRRVIADCLEPPIQDGKYDLLVSNNFMHHVTKKSETISNWAKVAETVCFNEDTQDWSKNLFEAVRFRVRGEEEKAERFSEQRDRVGLQSLLTERELDAVFEEHIVIEKKISIFDKSSYALATYFDYLLGQHGPPTPEWLKKLTSKDGWLGRYIMDLSLRLAEAIVVYDSHQTRKDDVLIHYRGKGKNFRRNDARERAQDFICPDCKKPIEYGSDCGECGARHPVMDGMWFLLPASMKNIADSYKHDVSEATRPEHL